MTPTEPRALRSTATFRKDFRRARKRGYDLTLLRAVLSMLVDRDPLPASMRDHGLVGEYADCRECHIQPDWLLIYQIADDDVTLIAMRTGTHADLFAS